MSQLPTKLNFVEAWLGNTEKYFFGGVGGVAVKIRTKANLSKS